MFARRVCSLLITLACCGVLSPAQVLNVREMPPPDARMKADILLIVAHPDDETAVAAYFAKAIYDLHKRVAIIYCNRGTGGGNSIGIEQGKSMGLIREIEVRKATSRLGIENVWVLNGRDTPSQDLFQSLQNWNHGAILEDVVRIIRLTRPEVILTWLPQFVAGENHGDHQASGVIATEAYDCAGDPTVFPAQVAVPRERTDINNLNEGLIAWQPKKLYYFSDASHSVQGDGPSFDVSEVSPSKHVPYYMVGSEVQLPHKTQGDVSANAEAAIAKNDYEKVKKEFERFHLLFGKAVVPCSPKGDLFEGITAAPAPYVAHAAYAPASSRDVSVALGGVFAFYRDFWKTHGVERIALLVPYEMEVSAGSYLNVPLLLHNGTPGEVAIDLAVHMPDNWHAVLGPGHYRIPAGTTIAVQAAVQCGNAPTPQGEKMLWELSRSGAPVSSVSMSIRLVEWALPQ